MEHLLPVESQSGFVLDNMSLDGDLMQYSYTVDLPSMGYSLEDEDAYLRDVEINSQNLNICSKGSIIRFLKAGLTARFIYTVNSGRSEYFDVTADICE